MDKIKTDKSELKKFSLVMFIALFVISAVLFLKGRENFLWFYSLGALFFVTGIFRPGILKLVYIAWMKLAFVLGWVNTRIILALVFYLVLTPIGLLMKLFGADLLDLKTGENKDSYWHKGEPLVFSKERYEKQY